MKFSPTLRRLLWSAAFLLALASPLCAADYFVAITGSDNNNGLTAARPFRNVARAALLATAPGDTCLLYTSDAADE